MARVHRVITGFLVALAAVALGSSIASANEAEFDNYVVHYNVINTTFLSPEVARAYDVRRSSNRAMVNISVMERGDNGLEAVAAEVSGSATNMNDQMRSLRFREVRDGDAIYYLSEVTVRSGETLDFAIDITPADSERELPVRFVRDFYVD
ncbi:DUF4426 domain-containing protein [Thioalkalivibrio sp. ALJ16]|uniref:DUF4426 domain-containing protein n=1 Tax=Thioalkalivibrio sp. ALJ16 TaxID=1158762 RepID=UPI0003A13D0C|nr:DUF4426 domain-containing protein [Thioalkalivibrio sp. ALJ16]